MNCIKDGKYTGDSCFGCSVKIGDCEIRDKVYRKRWIPCSERLPDYYGCYLVAWTDERNLPIPFYEIVEFDNGSWCEDIRQAVGKYRIIAWMPLPEPYKEESK